MRFLKAIDTDGETVYLAVSHILSIKPRKCGDVTVVMGAGLYWQVRPETMEFVDLETIPGEIMGGMNHETN